MVFEGLDAGDETRRNGDYVGFEHPDADGTALDSVTIPRGRLVAFDGDDLSEVTATTETVAGVLANYDVYGDTGQEEVKGKANVKVRGEVLAELPSGNFTPSEGSYLDDGGDVFVVENVRDDIYRVQVR